MRGLACRLFDFLPIDIIMQATYEFRLYNVQCNYSICTI